MSLNNYACLWGDLQGDERTSFSASQQEFHDVRNGVALYLISVAICCKEKCEVQMHCLVPLFKTLVAQ